MPAFIAVSSPLTRARRVADPFAKVAFPLAALAFFASLFVPSHPLGLQAFGFALGLAPIGLLLMAERWFRFAR